MTQISAASIPADTRDAKRRVLKDVFGFDDSVLDRLPSWRRCLPGAMCWR